MDRRPEFEMKDAPPEIREIYETALRGEPGSIQKLLARRPEVLGTFLAFYGTVGRKLDKRVYEMVYIRVSAMNGCHHCVQHHIAASKRVGLVPEDWQALMAGDYSRFDARQQAALRFAENTTRDPDNVSDANVEALKAHFSREQVVDLDMLVGLANLTSRLPDPLTAGVRVRNEKA